MKNVFKTLALLALIALGIIACEPLENETYCDELIFTEQGSFDGDYYYANIQATEVSIDEEVTYEWKVNGEVQNTTSSDIFLELEEGEYEICVSIETSDCPLGVSYCETLVIESDEDSIEMEVEEEETTCEITTYPFTYYNNDGNAVVGIEIDGLGDDPNEVYYEWKIDNEYIDNEGSAYLESTFTENGTYEICVMAETPECPQGVIACETIVIDEITEDICDVNIDHTLTYYENESTVLGSFEAYGDAEMFDVENWFMWSVNGEADYTNYSNVFYYNFSENGTYEICFEPEIREGCEGICKTIVVDQF